MTKQIKIHLPTPTDDVAIETAIGFLYARGYVVAKKTNIHIAKSVKPLDPEARANDPSYDWAARNMIAMQLGRHIATAAIFTEEDDPTRPLGRTVTAMVAMVTEFEEPQR